MRSVVVVIVGLSLALAPTGVLAQDDLPPGARDLFVCGTVYGLHANDLVAEGDESGADEFFHLGDAVTEQGVATLEAFGYTDDEIDEISWNIAMTEGFRYGAGEADEMLAACLAAQDSP